MSNYIFVDVEAMGLSPANGVMTEFGAVHEKSLDTFHGILAEAEPDPENPAKPIITGKIFDAKPVMQAFADWLVEVGGKERPVFVSDNVAYDWMWVACYFDRELGVNPFGHSGRRISDFYAGLMNNWGDTQQWKTFRQTPHTHNPVDDAMGNVEAFQVLKEIASRQRYSAQMSREDIKSLAREFRDAS